MPACESVLIPSPEYREIADLAERWTADSLTDRESLRGPGGEPVADAEIYSLTVAAIAALTWPCRCGRWTPLQHETAVAIAQRAARETIDRLTV